MTAKTTFLDRFIFEEYRARTAPLGIYRILFAAFVLTYLPQHLWVPNFPDSFFNPPIGLTLFFTGFPGLPFFYAVNALAIVAAVCLLFGYRTRVASTGFALLLLTCDYWAYSFGKINHDIPLIFIPLIMQFAGWGDGYSMDAKFARGGRSDRERTTAWPLALVALIVGLAMMTAAAPKAASGWLNLHTHAVRAHMLYNVFVTGRSNWFAGTMLRIKSGAFWEFFDYSTVVIEGAFLLAVARRQAFRVVAALACFFHLGIALSMEIAFVGNIIAYAAVADWSAFESRATGVLGLWTRFLERLSAGWILGFGAAVAFIDLRFGNPLQFPQEWDPLGTVLCALAALVAGVFLFGLIRSCLRRPRRSVILFDGFCGLCNGWVDFVLGHDRRFVYQFAALQSPAGQEILERLGLPPDFVDSFILVEDGKAFFRSSAVLRSLLGLGLPYSLASAFLVVPEFFRDHVYRFVARHRLSWFSKRNTCRMPAPEEAGRFL